MRRTLPLLETGHCIAGAIRAYWERNGGLAIFGYPISDLAVDSVYDEYGGFTWSGPVQWFERDWLEDHSGVGQEVMAGRLGAEQLHNLTVSLVVPRPAPVAHPFSSGGALAWVQSKGSVYVYGPGEQTTTFPPSP